MDLISIRMDRLRNNIRKKFRRLTDYDKSSVNVRDSAYVSEI